MAKVAFVLADAYEDSEFRVPYDRVKQAGHEPVVVGVKAGATVKGKRGDDSAEIEESAADVSADDFAALVIPGGYSPDKLRMHESVVDFVRAFFAADKPVAAICHAASLLVEADALRGRTVTSWPSVRKDCTNAGATWVDRQVVLDGNLVTSRKPDDLDAFCKALLAEIAEPARR
jgi:protease I